MQRCTQVVACILFALVLGSCSKTKDETALVVTVWTDFAAPSELDAITLRVSGQEKTKDYLNPLAASVPSGKPALQMALVPGAGDNQALTIEAVGSFKGTEIVWQKARVHFTADQQHELVLFLGKICQAKACETTPLFTCDRGECIKPVESGTELPVHTRGTAGSYPDAAAADRADVDGIEVRGDGDSRDAFAEASRPEVPSVVPDTQLPDAAEPDVPLATGGTGGMGAGGVGGGAGTESAALTGGSSGGGGTADAGSMASGGNGGIAATAGASGTGGVDGGAVDSATGGASALDAPVDVPVDAKVDTSVDLPPAIIDAPVSPGDTGGTGGTDVGADTLGTGGTGGSGGPDASTGPSPGPCDIYAAASTPCVAAYSVIRVLSKSYTGPLFQIRAGSSSTNNTMSGGTTKDIMPGPDGFVSTADVDAACGLGYCTVSVLYDQTGRRNDLVRGNKGPAGTSSSALDDYESCANALNSRVKAGGHTVYPLYMQKFEGYRTPVGVGGDGMPVGGADQGIYMLADGSRNATACCWEFGNVVLDPQIYGDSATLFLGTGFWGKGNGNGPWFEADFGGGGTWAGGSATGAAGAPLTSGPVVANTKNPPMLAAPFALGMMKVYSGNYALRMANILTATDLSTAYADLMPNAVNKPGGIALGVGINNDNASFGTFYEGAIVTGLTTETTDLTVMRNIQTVGYSKQ